MLRPGRPHGLGGDPVTNPAKRKGDRAELEAAGILSALFGWTVRRKLGAGRQDDTGDLDGVPDSVVQVCNWRDILKALRVKPVEAEQQRRNAGARFAATMMRLPRGQWRVVLTCEQYADLVKAATR